MDTETPATETIEASLSAVASKRKRGGRKAKVTSPVRVDAIDMPIDGDVSMELEVENVPAGYRPVWLSLDDQGRFRRRPYIQVKWGNKWGCRPAFAGDEKEGEPVRVKELTLYLEPVEYYEARMTRERGRLDHAERMRSLRQVQRANGVTANFSAGVGAVTLPVMSATKG